MRVRPESSDGNPLKEYFLSGKGNKIIKWHHYFDIYHNHFQRFRGRAVKVLEIGVHRGGSLQMWKEYFGPEAEIFGVDIDPRCETLQEDRIKILIGDQADRKFLERIKKTVGIVDVLIDDGGHSMKQQHVSFDSLYDLVDRDGVYVVEDLHTSYWATYGAGHRQPGSFIERAKGMIDSLNAWHSRSPDYGPDSLTKTTTGIHFYDSVLVIEKCTNSQKPKVSKTGHDPFEEDSKESDD